MSKFVLSCATNRPGNTGFNGSCFPDIGQLLGAYIVPVDLKIPQANLTRAGILSYLGGLSLNDDAFQRVYPVHNFIGAETSGGDRRTFTSPYGSILTTGENDYGFRFQYTSGGMQLQGALRAFNSNGQWAVIFYDAKNVYLQDNNDGTASGLPTTTTWSEALTPNNGTDPTLYYFFVGMKTIYLNNFVYVLQYDGNPAAVKGLQDITLSQVNWNEATGVANVKAQVGEIDLYDAYSTELADPALWTAYNAATGAVITITSVAANPGSKAWTVTIDTTDADYPSAAQGIRLNLVGPTELDAVDVTGYESAGALTLPTT